MSNVKSSSSSGCAKSNPMFKSYNECKAAAAMNIIAKIVQEITIIFLLISMLSP